MPQDVFTLLAFQNKKQLVVRNVLAQRLEEHPPRPLVRGMAVDDYAIQIENDCLQHPQSP
jgi:hypothetical protein